MIQHLDVQQLARRVDLLGHPHVFGRRRRVAGGVVVDDDDRRAVAPDGLGEELGRADDRLEFLLNLQSRIAAAHRNPTMTQG